jgi:hypothetical protein
MTLSKDPLQVLNQQLLTREQPSYTTAVKGYSRLGATDYEHAPLRCGPHCFIEVVDLIAKVMQTPSALQKSLNWGTGACRFNQFDARITRTAWVNERYANTLQRVVPSF